MRGKALRRRGKLILLTSVLHAAMLHRLYAVFQDYHQALGYVCSFLSLTIDEETVIKVCAGIHPPSGH